MTIGIEFIQSRAGLALVVTIPEIQRLLGIIDRGSEEEVMMEDGMQLRFMMTDSIALFEQHEVWIRSGDLKLTLVSEVLGQILRVALVMFEKGFDLEGEIEGHVVLLLDGSTVFIPH